MERFKSELFFFSTAFFTILFHEDFERFVSDLKSGMSNSSQRSLHSWARPGHPCLICSLRISFAMHESSRDLMWKIKFSFFIFILFSKLMEPVSQKRAGRGVPFTETPSRTERNNTCNLSIETSDTIQRKRTKKQGMETEEIVNYFQSYWAKLVNLNLILPNID